MGDDQSTAEPAPTREQRRSRRKRLIRARTISIKRLTKRDLDLGRLLYPTDPDLPPRPATRGECQGHEGPCPYVSCVFHLYLDVHPKTGNLKLNFPDQEVWELKDSCVLDVTDRGGQTLEEIGAIMNLTRERIRQIEVRGAVKAGPAMRELYAEPEADGSPPKALKDLPETEPRDLFYPEQFADVVPERVHLPVIR